MASIGLTVPGRRVVIFGGDGMLARALLKPLRRAGFQCVPISHAQCDITSTDSVIDQLRKYQPNVILNCAAHTRVDQCESEEEVATAVNGFAVGQLALFARVYDAKLLHFSTDAVFAGDKQTPYKPADPAGPLSAYARSKLRGEQEVQNVNPTGWLIIRTAWLFGDGHCFPRTILEHARKRRELSVVNDQAGSPSFAEDVADASVELLRRGAAGIWHVVNAGEATWFDVACETLAIHGLDVTVKPITTKEYVRTHPNQARRPAYAVLDTDAYLRAVGASLRHWRDALRDASEMVAPVAASI